MQPLSGMPGTVADAVRRINWFRMPDDERAGARVYEGHIADGRLVAMVSQDPAGKGGTLLWHLSVSHKSREGKWDRVPTWDELKHAAYRLIPADVPLVLIFPRRSTPAEMYVNVADTCLHLWESTEGRIDR